MQHLLQVSRKVDYALRAMIYLAGKPAGVREPLQEIATRSEMPKDFLAKIVNTLVDAGLVTAVRGPHGGVAIAKPASEISFLDVIEAVEGPIQLNLCLDDSKGCTHQSVCTMQSVWKAGQEQMLNVYRATKLSDLVRPEGPSMPVQLGVLRPETAADAV